ncbi:MAG TPA: DNA internalization-related competence protein ComEC/Rec2 [Kiritimatiellia bacterium]|nr:DNA internalization-related competence protein ComEC/Rec2 [Kiritimatiellia bacterium]
MEVWIAEELRGMSPRVRPPRRRIMAGLALPVIAGTATGICAPVSSMWFWGAGALLLLPLFVWVRHRWSVLPLMLGVFLLVAAHARQSTSPRAADSLSRRLPRPMEYVQLVAWAREDAAPRGPDAVFLAQVEGLNRDGTWHRVHDRIRVVLRGAANAERLPRYGERWRLHGIVRPAVPRRTGLFTLPQNQAVVDKDRAVFLDAERGQPLVAWCMRQRRICRAILARGLEDFPEERGVLHALLLGYREDLPRTLRQDFAATGTVHIFAISGAHVGMVSILIVGFLRAIGIPMTRWFLFLAPLLGIYTITTGAATSAIRAFVMATMMLAGPFLKRRPDPVSGLAVAAMAILLAAPAQLGDLGFLLSFTAVAGLLAIQPLFDVWAVRVFRRDAWQLPAEERPTGRTVRETGLYLTRLALVTVSAWISTSPLTAYFFNLFSPVALGMNLLVIPTAFYILLSGVISLVCASISGGLSEIFNHAGRALASFLAFCIQWAADVPGGHWFVRTPPAAGIIVFYVILAAAAVMARKLRGVLAGAILLLAALTLGWGVWDGRRCRVSVLDVGEGNATLVQAQRQRILIDTGPRYRAEELLRQLRSAGVNKLDVVMLSHADARHMGAAQWLLDQVPVGELWIPAVLWPSPLFRQTLERAAARGIPVRRLRTGEAGDWSGTMYWEVFWPPETLALSCADDGALVLRVARFGVSILLAGDAGDTLEEAMMASGRSLAASLFVAGRHGDASATSAAWLEAVRPQDVIISSGPHADQRHPDEKVLSRLVAQGVRVWRTDQQGIIHVELAAAPARWPAAGYRLWTAR